MGLTWKLDCTDTIGIVQGLTIFYCPGTTMSSFDCKGKKLLFKRKYRKMINNISQFYTSGLKRYIAINEMRSFNINYIIIIRDDLNNLDTPCF